MKKIWQKSLASMVSAALCLTAFVGCLTVNAATVHTGTINSNGVAVATTATEAKLDVAVSVSNVTPGIAYTGLKATTEFGTLKGVEIKSGDVKVEELSTDGVTSIPAIDENGSFIIAAKDTSVGANDYVLTLTFAKNASVELVDGAKYPVTITYLGSKDVGAANWNEDPIGFNVAVKDITVTASTPACEHTWVVSGATPATDATNGTATFTCSKCGKTETNVPVSFDAKAKFVLVSATCSSEILMNFDAAESYLGSYEEIAVVVDKEVWNANGETTHDYTYYNASDITGTYVHQSGLNMLRWSLGIPPKMANDNVTAMIYLKRDGQWYNGTTATRSLVQYITNVYSGVETKEQKLFASMLNFATWAQKHFNYDANNLALDKLTDKTYVSDEIVTATNYYSQDKGSSTVDSVIWAGASLNMESKTEINFEFAAGADVDPTTLTFNVWQSDATGSINNLVQYVHKSVATEQQLKDGHYFEYNRTVSTYKTYLPTYSDFFAKDMRVLVKASVTDTNGVQIADTLTYSVESRVARAWADSSLTDTEKYMFNAMLAYGDAAAAMFG